MLRIDDLDLPRLEPGADALILTALSTLGLKWDGEVCYQSQCIAHYRDALDALTRDGRVYPCACSRRQIGKGPYPGTCRAGLPPGTVGRSLRLRTTGEAIGFSDQIQGLHTTRIETEFGDFIVRRADGLFAYHLATVVDDARQGVTEVVRGADLLPATPLQVYLQRLLGLPEPSYMHIPVAIGADGDKLSKQTKAPPIDLDRPGRVLWQGLQFLGQTPPLDFRDGDVSGLLAWAIHNWELDKVPRCSKILADPHPGSSTHRSDQP